MISCNHTAWVKLSVDSSGFYLVTTDRLIELTNILSDPKIQYPSLLFFLGQRNKDEALSYLFPYNNLRKSRDDGIARLNIDNAGLSITDPVLFADADLSITVPEQSQKHDCHAEQVLPVRWRPSDPGSVADHAFTRAMLSSSHILIVFADDYSDKDSMVNDLVRWVNIGISPSDVQPRLLIVTTGDTADSQKELRSLYRELERRTCGRLTRTFSAVSSQYLEGRLSPQARYRALKEEVIRQMSTHREKLVEKRRLFSAFHLGVIFAAKLDFVATHQSGDFDMLQSSRKYHEDTSSFIPHIKRLIEFGISSDIRLELTTSYLASSMLMDAYPIGAHPFEPDLLFTRLYNEPCRNSFKIHYTDDVAEIIANDVRKHFAQHYEFFIAGGASAAELHKTNICAKGPIWKRMKSNETCLTCLRGHCQHSLSCGHSLCDACVSTFGAPILTQEYHYRIRSCFLCDQDCRLVAKLKPPTCGLRIISIDGGGTRGVIPLEFIRLIQQGLGSNCSFHDFFDFAIGTSSGGLIVLILMLYRWDVDKCNIVFEDMARKLFKRPKNAKEGVLPKVQKLVRSWLQDGQYTEEAVETCLKTVFGVQRRMFQYSNDSTSGPKVAVTALSISDASCFLFNNYNTLDGKRNWSGYTALPHGKPGDEIPVWQAARATSAAPSFFRPTQVKDHGSFQDGGLRFNNPMNLAISECRYIWPSSNRADLVLSLGTGTTEVRSPKAPTFRHFLNDGFVSRVLRSFTSSMDGQRTWWEHQNGIGEDTQRFFRLNLDMDSLPPIDDVECIKDLRRSVHFQLDTANRSVELVSALLTASFFFELDCFPSYEAGNFRCSGKIRCRNDAGRIIEILTKMYGNDLEFAKDTEFLTKVDGAICKDCLRFQKPATFVVKDLTSPFTIHLRSGNWHGCKISGFPQAPKWFIAQQRLDAYFGFPGRHYRVQCLSCERGTLKRKGCLLLKAQSKRRRHGVGIDSDGSTWF